MKKILKVMIILLVLSMGKVRAETFYEDNYVNAYATYIKGDFTKSQHMRFIRRYGDDLAIYCLTPDKLLYEDEVYTARFYNIEKYLNITKEKYKRISEVAYFGYNYKNHTDSKWYAVTQMMLWKEMDPEATIFYTDKFKGNKITKYVEEEKEIENLIKNYHILPNIDNLDLTYNKEYLINDSNNILNEYQIEDNPLDIKIENNKLKIKASIKGTYKIKLIRKDGTHSHVTIPYTASKGQNLLIRGYIDRPYKEITINITGSNLEIKKVDSETLNSEARGEVSVEGANYKLYDENNNLVDTLIINEDGTAKIENIKYGNYTLKETKAPTGYNLDNKTYNIKIDEENKNIILKENIIKSKLIINKYLKDDNNLKSEKNITFSIYDNNNNLVNKITTDDNGKASIELIYGKYKIIQENTTLGYKKVEDFYVEINNNEDKIINLEDNRINVNLKINKKDIDSNKNIILSNTSFKIKDLQTNKYIKYNDSDIFTTNNEGIINLNIKGGKYRLEEVISPNGYMLGDNVEFVIDSDIKELELNIYNKKQYGKLKIIKQGKLLNNNYILLKNVKFNIYAYQDIISGDNTMYYKKDELVDTVITDINGIAISKDLIIGKYYIEEVNTLDNFIIDKNKYVIDFNNNLNIDIINKEIIITNQEKEIIIEKNDDIDKIDIDNIEMKDNDKKIENKNLIEKSIYPKTSNTDIYINTIICYLSLFGIILIISSVKNEKIRNILINNKFSIIKFKKRNRKG